MLLEVLLAWHGQLDSNKLETMLTSATLLHNLSEALPASLEAGDDGADQATLDSQCQNNSSQMAIDIQSYLDAIRLDRNEAARHQLTSPPIEPIED